MKRLTKTYEDKTHGAADDLPCGENSWQYKGLLLEALGKYEDLEEQGLLIKLPCKVGDTVYYPDKANDYIYPVRISQIIISDLGDGKYCLQYNGCFFDSNNDPYQEFEFDKDDFGKTVFTKQFAAEMELRDKK